MPIGYAALPSQPLGFFSFLDRSKVTHLFAGTATKLFHFQTGDVGFNDVTKVAATYAASVDNPWEATAFGANRIIFTNGADPPQSYIIGASNFTDLDATAPVGRYVVAVRDFIFFGNTNEAGSNFPQRVHWGAIGGTSFPTPGSPGAASVQSDRQDLRSDLGHIRGLASNLNSADVAIFMDYGIYYGHYVGNQVVFDFQIAQGAAGCSVPGSIVANRGFAFYLGTDGFYQFDGVSVNPIGAQKIDNFFYNDPDDGVNTSFLDRIQSAASPNGHLILWLYCGPGSTGIPNRCLIYNWQLQRWSVIRIDATLLGRGLTSGYSLDQLDAFTTSGMDGLPFSLDSDVWSGGNPILMGFDNSFQLGAFGGSPLAAIIETMEAQPSPGYRSRITSARPLVDGGATASVSLAVRSRLQDPPAYGSAVTTNIYGECPQRVDGRYVRAQIDIPAGASWSHVQGIELDSTRSTRR
jgi:hypothetical protein